MGAPRNPEPALLVVAAFSRHSSLLIWTREHLALDFGPVALASAVFPFDQTKYYEPTMGAGLQKQLLAFEQLVGQDQLAAIKGRTNAIEQEIAAAGAHTETRPLNLDPGLLTLGKFLLATTKDQAHRIYLQDGIYAEVTLRFQAGKFEPWPWTYADYQETDLRAALKIFRDYYKQRLQAVARQA
jgi:hypothetical protein